MQKVKQYRMVAYPDKDAVNREPDLLLTMPERWHRNAAAYAAMAFTSALLLSGCDNKMVKIYDHGKGVCFYQNTLNVTMGLFTRPMPIPVMTEESAAYSIIQDEFNKQGITIIDSDIALKAVELPSGNLNWQNRTEFHSTKEGQLVLDGQVEDMDIAFEYVSTEDIVGMTEWDQDDPNKKKPIVLDMRAGAQALAKSLKGNTGINAIAVFYDPINDSKPFDGDNETRQQWLEQSHENLRQQVRDFIAWLKAQGII